MPDLAGPNAPHWLGAREGRLVVQVCSSCGTARYPHSFLCPACSAGDANWQAIRTTGRVLSWCRFHRRYFEDFALEVPYTVLLVRMDDGVKLFANWVAAKAAAIPVIGERVEAAFEELVPGTTVVRFRQVAESL